MLRGSKVDKCETPEVLLLCYSTTALSLGNGCRSSCVFSCVVDFRRAGAEKGGKRVYAKAVSAERMRRPEVDIFTALYTEGTEGVHL